MEVLGTQIDAIANGFLGLPIKGDLFEAIFKFIADNRDEERSLKEKKLLGHAHEFLKTIKRQFEPQPDPNFKLVDDHTRFFHFLLTQQTKNGQEVTASDICLPKVIFLYILIFYKGLFTGIPLLKVEIVCLFSSMRIENDLKHRL